MEKKLFTKERREHRIRFYKTKTWLRIRKKQLSKHPLCQHCLTERERVYVRKATVVDHENPDWQTWKEFCSGPFNSLCDSCHRLKTSFSDIPKLIKKQKTKIEMLDV